MIVILRHENCTQWIEAAEIEFISDRKLFNIMRSSGKDQSGVIRADSDKKLINMAKYLKVDVSKNRKSSPSWGYLESVEIVFAGSKDSVYIRCDPI